MPPLHSSNRELRSRLFLLKHHPWQNSPLSPSLSFTQVQQLFQENEALGYNLDRLQQQLHAESQHLQEQLSLEQSA